MAPVPVAPVPIGERIDERIEELLATHDDLISTGKVVDLLLDVRNEVWHPMVRVHVDDDLRTIGARHVLTSGEVHELLERLVPILHRADGVALSRWRRR